MVIEETPNVNTLKKIIHEGIIRLKQQIAHISKHLEGCPSVLVKVSQSIKLYMSNVSNEKMQMKK